VSDLSAWILSIGAFAAIVVCMAVAAKSIAGDPPRGRRRCPRCWHELGPAEDGSGIRPCGECGYLPKTEQELRRTRRSIARAVIAVAAIVAIAMATRMRMLDRGVWSMAPTSVLLALAPYADGGGFRTAPWELAHRIRSGAASDAQVREGLRLFIAGDAGAAPASTEWRAKYRDLGSAVIARLGSGDPALEGMLGIPPSFQVSVIEGTTLQAGEVPPLLVLDADVWWPAGYEGRLEIGFPDGSIRRAEFQPGGRFPALVLELPERGSAVDELDLRLASRQSGLPLPDQGWREHAPVRVPIPKTAARSPRRWLAKDSPEMRAAISTVFDAGLVLWTTGPQRGGMRFDSTVTSGELFEDVAIGLKVEVCERGVPRRTSRMWWPGGSSRRGPRWLSSIEDPDAMDRLYRATPEETARDWSLRITGDEQLAHYGAVVQEARAAVPTIATDADGNDDDESPLGAWFSGSVEVALVVERQTSPSPVRRWRILPP
jgi:hypothetical protein